MSDPLSSLRAFYQAGRLDEIKEEDGNVILGDTVWPRDAKTNFRIHGSQTGDDGLWDHYTLGRMVSFLRSIIGPDRRNLLNYLEGAVSPEDDVALSSIREETETLQDSKKTDIEQLDPDKNKLSSENRFKKVAGDAIMARTGEDRFQRLPDEVVVRVLSSLDPEVLTSRVSLVSKRFRRLCQDKSLQSKLRIHEHNAVADAAERAVRLLDRHPFLETLAVGMQQDSLRLVLPHALQHCPRLRTLQVGFLQGKGFKELLRAIALHGASLRRLSISSIRGHGKLEEASAASLKNLTHLSLEGRLFRDGRYASLADHCHHLRELVFTGSPQHDSLNDGMVYFLQRVQDSIRCLKFDGYSLYGDVFGGGCRKLEKLQLLGQSVSVGRSMFAAISGLPELKVLHVADLFDNTHLMEAFRAGGGGLGKQLRELHVSTRSITDIGRRLDDGDVATVGDRCPLLLSGGRSLRLQQCGSCCLAELSSMGGVCCRHFL